MSGWGIVILALVIHLRVLGGGLVWLDHGDLGLGRGLWQNGWRQWLAPFGETGFWRPVVGLSLSVDAYLYRQWWSGFHLTNWIMGAMVAYMAWWWAGVYWGLKQTEKWWVGLVMAIHPATSMPIGLIAYRPELLAGGLSMLSLGAYVKGGKDWRWVGVCLVTAVLAWLSKETAIIWTVGGIVWWEVWLRERSLLKWKNWKRYKVGIGMVGLLVVYGLLRWLVVKPRIWQGRELVMNVMEEIGVILTVLGRMGLALVGWGADRISDAVLIGWSLETVVGLLVLVIGVGLWRLRSWRGVVGWLAITLVPISNLVELPRVYSVHYGYLALSGVGVMAAKLWSRGNKWVRIGLVVWVVLLASQSLGLAGRYDNDRRLFEREVERDRNFLEGRYYLGNYWLDQGEAGKAKTYYEEILQAKSRRVIAHIDEPGTRVNLGLAWMKLDEPEKAVEEWELVRQMEASGSYYQGLAVVNLAGWYRQQEEWEKVVEVLEEVELSNQTAEGYLWLVEAWVRLGEMEKARDLLGEASGRLEGEELKRILRVRQAFEMSYGVEEGI